MKNHPASKNPLIFNRISRTSDPVKVLEVFVRAHPDRPVGWITKERHGFWIPKSRSLIDGRAFLKRQEAGVWLAQQAGIAIQEKSQS